MKRSLRVACSLPLLVCSLDAAAFTFSDGTSAVCTAQGKPVREVEAPPTDPVYSQNRIALTATTASGPVISWNAKKLKTLPPEMRDFIFFHECAHIKVPTTDELAANCAGLKDMRAAGRAGLAVEAKLSAFYGPGNAYWANTQKCANEGAK